MSLILVCDGIYLNIRSREESKHSNNRKESVLLISLPNAAAGSKTRIYLYLADAFDSISLINDARVDVTSHVTSTLIMQMQ